MSVAPGPLLEEMEKIAPPAAELRLLVVSESPARVFLRNLRDLVLPRRVSPLDIQSAPAAFWVDVFVERGLPWRRLLQSGACHILAIAVIWAGSRFPVLQPRVKAQPAFTHADVIYYTPSEYLPALDTRRADSAPAQQADPEFSAQPIISVPAEATNRTQTVVTAPAVQLQHDVPLPNIVAWQGKPQMPIAPAPLVPASQISRLAPAVERSVIAPPPSVDQEARPTYFPQQSEQGLQPAVIAPPPTAESASNRRIGELNIGSSSVIAPAPQLALDAQRTVTGANSNARSRGQSPQVVAPPPSLGATGRSRSGEGIVALNLHPTVGAPPVAEGNRRGAFAATPAGRHGASGAPGSTGSGNSTSSGSRKAGAGDLPAGLYVGKTANTTAPVAGNAAPANSNANSVNPNLMASAQPPRVSARTMQSESGANLTEEERAVFGNRKFYSLSLNMPNLNSAGGSWIIRFAALKADAPGRAAPDDLSSPVATRKVDPAYPLELMRQNVGGTVILYGVIHADGTVGDVRVLRSVDDRLDQFASTAIGKWQFQPAMKNGAAVDVEATFWIPFRPVRGRANF